MAPSPSLRCSAVLFDLDGVLVDSVACVEATWRQWAARHHLDSERIIKVAHGRRTLETLPLVAPHLNVAEEAAALAAIESTTTEGVFEVPGARELAERLPSDAWAIVTSGVRSVATLRIRHVGLPFPRVLVCADDITRGKPDPEGYLVAAEQLGRRPDGCVVIEDTPAGIEAARNAGMRVVAVVGTYPPDTLGSADLIVARLASLRVSRAGSQLQLAAAGA
jgi:sugar-phosphatase